MPETTFSAWTDAGSTEFLDNFFCYDRIHSKLIAKALLLFRQPNSFPDHLTREDDKG